MSGVTFPTEIAVLDHGYVKFVEAWGSDERIIESARMSTQKGFNGWGPMHGDKCATQYNQTGPGLASCDCNFNTPGDEKLLAFLWKNQHATPFEFAGLVVEVQAPIFVFREWHRHRTQSYNEASARYAPLPAVNYVPTLERVIRGGGHLTKQAGANGDKAADAGDAEEFIRTLKRSYIQSEKEYQWALQAGVPKELARLVLPVGRYTRMRAHANLRNWLAFITLRDAPNAQWEIQEYARAVSAMLEPRFPRTWKLFADTKR